MKRLTSKTSLVVLALLFALVILVFNLYDLGVDKTDSRAYTEQEIKSMKIEKININTATKEQLCEIPGVGESIAQSIIEYRKDNGKFKNIDELLNVSGIGEKDYIGMTAFVTI